MADPERHSRKKPRNWARTSFHVLSGVVWVLLYQYVVDQRTLLWMVAGWLVFFLVDDALRRWLPTKRSHLAVATFRALARSSESVRIASSTWYTLGLLVCVAALPKPACIVGFLILGLADPMAGLVGRRWGYTKLHRDKSVQGTLAFFATAMVVAVTSLSIHIPWMGLGEQLWAAMLIAASGAAAELAGDHVADNFSVPVITGMVAAFVGL